eukprot:TRINITY_DN8783_c1_g1_i1.p1 TRINITY_DN8783_c1_g1~~TRINITY_DN8783_c1_g1_i1.p1  ORF type:complete len:280 (+),score=46.38 TRINITY_DN8783_c1_g1_i1:25-840(+)
MATSTSGKKRLQPKGKKVSGKIAKKRPAASSKRIQSPGVDGSGRRYGDISELWKEAKSTWYSKVFAHWEAEEASVRGVLGGLPETHLPDLKASKEFLEELQNMRSPPSFHRVLDCGAGVGRVTKGLLLKFFKLVDLVESNKRLLSTAQCEIRSPKVDRFIFSSLQNFEPENDRYDVIWLQWVFLHLTDDDFVSFLIKCRKRLRPHGVICVKDNVAIRGPWVVDRGDNSIARKASHYKELFQKAGLRIVKEKLQKDWPAGIIPVKMYALRAA